MQMKELEDQISDETNRAIEKMIDSIEQKRARHRELRTQANHLHNPIILHVPPEIASSIFHFYVFEEVSDALADSSEHYKFAAPLTLGAVCRSWRQIAWSTPELWNFLFIVLTLNKFPPRCEAVREWLGRSGQLPLSIHISTNGVYDLLSDTNAMNPVIDVINGYSSRWYQLDLSIPSFLISRFVGDSRGVSTFILRKLRISADFPETEGRFPLKNVRPVPTNVALEHFRLKAVDIEWNNVTDVKLKSFHVDECIELLRRTPQLLRYKLVVVLPTGHHFQMPGNAFIHPLLRVLSVVSWPGDIHLDAFFNSLTLPALEYFHCNKSSGRLEIDSLASLFRRSTCPLSELAVLDAVFTDVEITDILRLVPSLRRLDLGPCRLPIYSQDNFFRLLAATSGISRHEEDSDSRGPFLPALQSIKFMPFSRLSWNLVPDIFGPVSEIGELHRRPLQHLQISFHSRESLGGAIAPYIDEGTIDRLLELIDSSISLELGIVEDSNDLLKLSMIYHGMAEEDSD